MDTALKKKPKRKKHSFDQIFKDRQLGRLILLVHYYGRVKHDLEYAHNFFIFPTPIIITIIVPLFAFFTRAMADGFSSHWNLCL